MAPTPIRNPVIKYTKLFVNNEWIDATDGSTFETYNPTTGEVICTVAEGKSIDIDLAVEAAAKAFECDSAWGRTDASARGVLLNKVADIMERDINYLASLETYNSGRLYTDNLYGDVPFAIKVLRYYAGWSDKNHGKTIPFDGSYFCYTKHEPVGICGAITPWNAPIIMFMLKVAPCLAMGNVLVLKPAEQTPLTALYLASLFKEVGFPPGVLNVVPGFGNTAGHALSHHMGVDKIAFTGSVSTGKLIQKASAESNLKGVTLELGGKNPNIVFSDVDVESAAKSAHTAMFNNAGQICAAGSRTFVHEDIFDSFVEQSVRLAKARKTGDPLELDTENCPLINEAQGKRAMSLLELCKKEGGRILCGGEKVEGKKGYFMQPTVVVDLTDDMTISKEEVFGPVQQIYKFKELKEVIKRANKTRFGLTAGVITNDINKVMAVSNGVRAGTIWVNCYFPSLSPGAPFGGFKESGLGRDMGEYALQHFTEVKTVITRIPE